MRLAVNQLTTLRWSLEEDLHHFEMLGAEGIGIWRPKLTDLGRHQGIDLVQQSRLAVSSLLWAGGFTGSEGRSHSESIDDGLDAVRLAADLQAGCLVVYSGGRGGHTWKHARRLVISAIRELVDFADELGVTMAFEPTHPICGTDWGFFHTIDDTQRLLDTIERPSLRVVLDTYHLGQEEDLLGKLAAITPQVALVHLGDACRTPGYEQDRCRLGQGIVPLREIVACLQAHGYDGFYEVELLGQQVEQFEYADLIRDAFTAMHDIASVAS